MGRREITAGLSELVERHLEEKTCVWAAEVSIESLGRCRPDYLSVSASWGALATLASIERAAVTVYEVKSCMADFKSGHGLNAVGDSNYIVCPYELMMEIHRRHHYAGEDEPDGRWGWAYPIHRDYGKSRSVTEMPRYEGQTDECWKLRFIEPNQIEVARPMPIFVYLWALLNTRQQRRLAC